MWKDLDKLDKEKGKTINVTWRDSRGIQQSTDRFEGILNGRYLILMSNPELLEAVTVSLDDLISAEVISPEGESWEFIPEWEGAVLGELEPKPRKIISPVKKTT